ncbi:MAG TPA: polysaccharide biosynthesis protein, partial [Xanthomarina gelatinilytica]|nr:polysaccharide biosynthesis protein [Xanthomarina gelatinilytica]
ELLVDGENTKPTYNEKIMIAKCRPINIEEIKNTIDELCKLGPQTQNIEIVSKIKDIVTEYNPNNTKYDLLNKITNS